MTKLEVLQAMIDFEVPENVYSKVLIDAGVDGAATYTVADRKEIDLCLAELYLFLATKADVKEGDLIITTDRRTFLVLRNEILAKYGLLEEGLITDVSSLW